MAVSMVPTAFTLSATAVFAGSVLTVTAPGILAVYLQQNLVGAAALDGLRGCLTQVQSAVIGHDFQGSVIHHAQGKEARNRAFQFSFISAEV